MTTDHLLDTNIVSETAKAQPDAKVLGWLETQSPLVLSSLSVYELARGVERTTGRKRLFLEGWLASLLGSNARILPFDETAARLAATIEQDARRRGHPIPERDLFILATARACGLRLATRNLQDFRGHGVALYNPFDDQHVP